MFWRPPDSIPGSFTMLLASTRFLTKFSFETMPSSRLRVTPKRLQLSTRLVAQGWQ